MKIFKYLLVSIIIFASLGYIGYGLYEYNKNPCSGTIEYGVGRFDAEFGISRERFIEYLQESHEVWNRAIGKETFVYNEDSDFKVNLIFDQRQIDTIQKQKTESGLSLVEENLRKLDEKLSTANAGYKIRLDRYEQEIKVFENRQKEYEKEVNYWNSRGGAPESDYKRLQNESIFLNNETKRLNEEGSRLNIMVKETNDLLKMRNDAARDYNRVADLYNKKYGKGLEFNQAEYSGQEINIYQFSGKKDLMIAMIHEFGHALGLDHVDDSNAVMYYLTGGNSEVGLELTEADLEEMGRVCKL